MSGFPNTPSDGDQIEVNSITYVYNSTKTAWLRSTTSGANLTANSLSITSDTAATSTTSGAVIVVGGVGVQGNIHAASVVAEEFIGDGSQLTGLPAGYTNSNVADYLPSYTGNIGQVNNLSPFFYNATTVTANVTIDPSRNAMSAGPITIAEGVTVTILEGGDWTVV